MQGTCCKAADQARVGRDTRHVFVHTDGIAIEDVPLALLIGLQVLVGGIDLAVTQVLLEAEGVVEGVLEFVAEGPLALLQLVEVLVTLPEIGQVIALLVEHR
ncbi:hypothetical protein D3C73_1260420 [compost metagenome]